jgi:flavodoxin
MPKAAVVYCSRTGITRKFAEEIGAYLGARGIEASVSSVGDCDVATLPEVDLLLLGCWTSGLMVVLQRPDGPWVSFARDLPKLTRPRVGLFATYKLATGGMFGKMREHLAGRTAQPSLELKSRDGSLSNAHRRALDGWIAGATGGSDG